MSRLTSHPLAEVKRAVRAVLVGPQLAAFLPAMALGLYWYGGEALLLVFAALFPALLLIAGAVTSPRGRRGWALDQLTGLPLRDTMLRQLDYGFSGEAEDGPRPALVTEIDDWSAVSNRHGAQAAETILRKSADRLRDQLRQDDLVVRLGDGRFGIVLKGGRRIDLESMVQVASRLQNAIGEPMLIDGLRVLVTASVGFCLPSRAPGKTGEAALNAAESALNEARMAGPASIRAFSRAMKPRASGGDFTTKEVLKALESGQIAPWFQPQISTDTGGLSGFEALARWQHPEQGQISPGAFLPVVARAGLMERLGEIILFKSLTALRDWDRAGLNVPKVSVNLSSDELRNPMLAEKIRWEIDRFELEPERLTLEVLENVVADTGDETVLRNLASLSQAGFGLDLDDFGTGHASITNIRRFSVSRIKIDRSFVTHVDTDRDQQNMIAAILTMAERLGVEAVAEGVENPGEHAMVAQLGCKHVQGYFIGRPMAFESTPEWISQHRAGLNPAPSLKNRA